MINECRNQIPGQPPNILNTTDSWSKEAIRKIHDVLVNRFQIIDELLFYPNNKHVFLKKFLRGSDHTHPHTQSWIITFSHLKHYWNGKRNENNGYLEYCLNLIWGDIKSIDSWKVSLHIVFHKVENNTAVSWQIGKMTSYDKLLSAFWNLNVLL